MWMLREVFLTAGTSANLPSKTNNGNDEPEKVIITTSIPTALWRCTWHLITISVTIAIVILDLKGFYLGADLMSPVRSETINLMFLQLAAKAHEIMIVASLGLIVFEFVRDELLFGEGLPFGLIGSGLTFNNLEFFLTKEFYGSLGYLRGHPGNRRRRIMFVIVVVVAGVTAALAGPASAVLLVPKSQDWAAGGTQFYLNGSASDFWPDDLSGVLLELQSYCNSNDSTSLGICPAGGFHLDFRIAHKAQSPTRAQPANGLGFGPEARPIDGLWA